MATSAATNQCSPSGNVSRRSRAPVAANTKSLTSIASWCAADRVGGGVLFCSYIEQNLRLGR
ncbi:hypothetical protein [Streptomyces sp. ID05-04B]|uniref:hypothetical protein n=1 Tax=unclassified Streptomyces TaxID=2593676 RepID=UPI0029C9CC70|nr:hypothetical protein [Streptomyces sp. ID05-04B]